MNIKKIPTIILVLLLLPVTQAWCGDTTVTGTMSCYMPPMLEYTQSTAADSQEIQPPSPSGASGNYAVQKEEKTEDPALIQTEEIKPQEKTIVYTIYAK